MLDSKDLLEELNDAHGTIHELRSDIRDLMAELRTLQDINAHYDQLFEEIGVKPFTWDIRSNNDRYSEVYDLCELGRKFRQIERSADEHESVAESLSRLEVLVKLYKAD